MKSDAFYADGQLVWRVEYDPAARIITWFYGHGVVDGPRVMNESEVARYGLQPLEGLPLVAALNAALGIWSLADAASVAGVSEQALVDEVTAWVVAGS